MLVKTQDGDLKKKQQKKHCIIGDDCTKHLSAAFEQRLLTFRVILQKEVEVAELTEQLWLHFALGLQDERIVAANSLGSRQKQIGVMQKEENTGIRGQNR